VTSVASLWTMQGQGEVVQAGGNVLRSPVVRGEPLDFAAFFADEHRGVLKLLYFVTGNRDDAAELMQEAFLKVWERRDRLGRADDPRAYLFRVALNGSRMRARAARRAARRLVAPNSSTDPYDEIDLREDVRRLLLSLAPRQRAALALLDMYAYSSEEAARIMDIRPSTVRALASQGRTVLRAAGGTHA
jgi:RNA polymerase sigma-70 factor (ECF subfamily)